jgi:hypothetical protein
MHQKRRSGTIGEGESSIYCFGAVGECNWNYQYCCRSALEKLRKSIAKKVREGSSVYYRIFGAHDSITALRKEVAFEESVFISTWKVCKQVQLSPHQTHQKMTVILATS